MSCNVMHYVDFCWMMLACDMMPYDRVIWDLFLPSMQGANGAAGRLAVAEDGLTLDG